MRSVDDALATIIVVDALTASYPTWTDEHGTNVEQLANIAVEALRAHGLLGAAPVEGTGTTRRPRSASRSR